MGGCGGSSLFAIISLMILFLIAATYRKRKSPVSSPVVAAAAAVRANVGALVEALTRPRPQPPPPDLRPWPQPPPPPASVDLGLVPEVPTDDFIAARADLTNAEQGVRDVIRRLGGVPDDEVVPEVPTDDFNAARAHFNDAEQGIRDVIRHFGGVPDDELGEVRHVIEELSRTLTNVQEELAIEDAKSGIVSQALSPDARTASESRRSPSQSPYWSPSATSERFVTQEVFDEWTREVDARSMEVEELTNEVRAIFERRDRVERMLESELERETKMREEAQAMLLDALQALHNLRTNSRWSGFDPPPPSDNLGLYPRESTPASESTPYTDTSPSSIASRNEIASLIDGVFGQIEETAAALTAPALRRGRSAGAAALVPATRTGESPRLLALREERRRLLLQAEQASDIANSPMFTPQDREANQMVVAQHMQVISEIEGEIINEQLDPQAEEPNPYVTPVQQPTRRGRSAGSEGLVPGGDWKRKSKTALKEEQAQKLKVLQAAIDHTNSPEYNQTPLVRKEVDAEVIGGMMAEINDLQAQIEEAENLDDTLDLGWV
jgi:hypothetical protein